MCTKVECEDVVITYFNTTSNKEITFKDLNEIRREIENKHHSVFVDVSFSSIRKTAIKFQDLMEIENGKIHLTKSRFPQTDIMDISPEFVEIIKSKFKSDL